MSEIIKNIIEALPKLQEVKLRPEVAVPLTVLLVVILVFILKT